VKRFEEDSQLIILIVEHDNGKTRYYGPFESQNQATSAAEEYFGYKNTPYHVTIRTVEKFSEEAVLNCKKQDKEI